MKFAHELCWQTTKQCQSDKIVLISLQKRFSRSRQSAPALSTISGDNLEETPQPQETMAPITPGSAAATFPASAFSQPARVLNGFLTPPELGVGGVVTPTTF